jgi:TfoX/Sxy family transcriptional regulator of competence genes
MAYDEALAARVRQALGGRADVVEKAMFGGVTFMVAGNMCCGVNRSDLILRLDANTTAEDLGSSHVRAWDFMKRPMPGIFAVGAGGCAKQEAVDAWVKLALKHALSLPPKVARAPKKPHRRR